MNNTAFKLSYLARVFSIVWAAAAPWLVAWAILLIVQGLLPVALVYLTKPLVDGMQAAIGHGSSWQSVQPVVLVAGAIGGVLILTELIKVALEWISSVQSELVQDHVSDLLHAKATSVDLAFFESPDFYDHMYRARNDANNRPLALLESSGSLVQNTVTVVAMAAVLFRYGAWLPPALLVSTLPAFYAVVRTSRRYHNWWKDTTTERRRTQYLGVVLTDANFAGEIRFFGLAEYFRKAFLDLRRRLRVERLRLLREQGLVRMGAEVIALLISAGTIAWMVWRAFVGMATLGDIALFYQAFQRGQGLMRALLTNIGQIYNNGLFLANLFEFLDLETQITEPANPTPAPARLERGIRFKDVTFRYPGTDRVALKNFNLTIPAGRTVAILGANGAGKTTLIKLLCRFYDPESGRVEIDGIDLRALLLDDLRKLITIMFQLPVRYQETARQNIGMGNLESARSLVQTETAARSAGAHELIASLPDRYDTDEPTSMMDSWAEAEWFDRFRDLAQDRTAIIITHHLVIAMRADVIHVMEHGQIVESGNHQELIAMDGLYSKSWRAHMESASSETEMQITA